MKLHTEIVDGTVQDRSDCRDKQWSNLEHDAAAAHALVQAMNEQINANHFSTVSDDAKKSLRVAKQRATEILAGWLGDRG